jgi:ABC-type dipeptide/oligopeptide/nickel transport system permease subunit
MSDVGVSYLALETSRPRTSGFRRTMRVMFDRKVVLVGAVIVFLFILVSIIGQWITPYDPYEMDLEHIRSQPSALHWLGTDEIGRDVLSRLILGARISLIVGLVGVFISGTVGMVLGLIAGYFGGWTNTIIMRFIDALLALPPLVLILAIATLLGGGLKNVLIALGVGMIPAYARLICGQILITKELDFITAAKSMGAGHGRIMINHLLLNVFPPMLVLITTNVGTTILMEASLSFLGIGVKAPTPTWGNLVSNGYPYLIYNPWLSIAPGTAILIVVLSINMLGDGLRDALDPKLRGVI